MTNQPTTIAAETRPQRLARILAGRRFEGLKAILDCLASGQETLCVGIDSANSYEELIGRLGFRVSISKQIHVQDCYSRVGPTGGIRAVLPYHDIPTQSSLPTLVNFDSTVTTTPKSSVFFNQMLIDLKLELNGRG